MLGQLIIESQLHGFAPLLMEMLSFGDVRAPVASRSGDEAEFES